MQGARTKDGGLYLHVARQAADLELLESLRTVLVARGVSEHSGEWAIGGITDGDVKYIVGNVAAIYESCRTICSTSKRTESRNVWRNGEDGWCGVGRTSTIKLGMNILRRLPAFMQCDYSLAKMAKADSNEVDGLYS